MDNGPEFISQALQSFCAGRVGLSYIPPRTPWNGGYIESINNRPRRGCLNRNHWTNLLAARVVIGDFKHDTIGINHNLALNPGGPTIGDLPVSGSMSRRRCRKSRVR